MYLTLAPLQDYVNNTHSEAYIKGRNPLFGKSPLLCRGWIGETEVKFGCTRHLNLFIAPFKFDF